MHIHMHIALRSALQRPRKSPITGDLAKQHEGLRGRVFHHRSVLGLVAVDLGLGRGPYYRRDAPVPAERWVHEREIRPYEGYDQDTCKIRPLGYFVLQKLDFCWQIIVPMNVG